MEHALIEFLLFFAEILVFVFAILFVVAGIVAITGKSKKKISIKNLDEHYKKLAQSIHQEIMSKKDYKQFKKQLKADKKNAKKCGEKPQKRRIFVINFKGDIKASAVDSLREEVSAILQVANSKDEIVVRLESSGGMMHAYGLGASQLQRIKDKAIPLTICVDKVAASGGYMMASVADKILAAPFAIIGSVGIITQLPNFHRFLKKHNIDFEQITVGQYKRTLSLFAENTKDGRKKCTEELEQAHKLFKTFIKKFRQQIDIEKIATGEYWFGIQALELQLVDGLSTSDDYLLVNRENSELYEIKYRQKKKLMNKINCAAHQMVEKILTTFQQHEQDKTTLM